MGTGAQETKANLGHTEPTGLLGQVTALWSLCCSPTSPGGRTEKGLGANAKN